MRKILAIIFVFIVGYSEAQQVMITQAVVLTTKPRTFVYLDAGRFFRVASFDSLDVDSAKIVGLNYYVNRRIGIYSYSKIQTDSRYLLLTDTSLFLSKLYASSIYQSKLGYTPYNSSNPAGYISTEIDPTVSSNIKAITPTNIANWNTAFSWGNHASLYPLLSGSYTNPSWIVSLPNTKITYSGNTTQYLRGDGTAATFPTIPTNTNQLTNGSGFIITEIDGSVTNEIQTLSISGNQISISSGNTITLPIPAISDYYNTANVAAGSGQVVFYLTSDKTSTGTALYSTIDAVIPIINDVTQNYTYGWSYNSGTKALTVTARTNLTAVVALVTVLLGPSNVANGTSVQILVKGH